MNMMCSDVYQTVGIGELTRDLSCAASCDMPILITGGDGADHRAVAEAIHRRSRRAAAPFLTVDCASASESLLESTLFGCGGADAVPRGTCGCFERAHCGTVFIANIDAMSSRIQELLLAFLENGDIRRVGDVPVHRKVDVRVMTSGDWHVYPDARRMTFREDLFYRLNVMHLAVPEGAWRSHSHPMRETIAFGAAPIGQAARG